MRAKRNNDHKTFRFLIEVETHRDLTKQELREHIFDALIYSEHDTFFALISSFRIINAKRGLNAPHR